MRARSLVRWPRRMQKRFAKCTALPIGAGPLSGTYSLIGGTNAAYDQVSAGEAMLAYDIAGGARENDGTGAAGCYERSVA